MRSLLITMGREHSQEWVGNSVLRVRLSGDVGMFEGKNLWKLKYKRKKTSFRGTLKLFCKYNVCAYFSLLPETRHYSGISSFKSLIVFWRFFAVVLLFFCLLGGLCVWFCGVFFVDVGGAFLVGFFWGIFWCFFFFKLLFSFLFLLNLMCLHFIN